MAATFIVDVNVGNVTRWLRMMGYDTLVFTGKDDGLMVKIAMKQKRIIVTKDGQVTQRRLVSSGQLTAIHIKNDDTKLQLKQVIQTLKLDLHFKPFSRCICCNGILLSRAKEEVRHRVPPHILETRQQYMECPDCKRIYWQGTHWDSMNRELENLVRIIQ